MPEPLLNHKSRALLALLQTLKSMQYSFVTISPLSHLRINTRQDHPKARIDDVSKPASKLQNLRDIFGWSRSFNTAAIDQNVYGWMRQAEIIRTEKSDFFSTVRVSSYQFYSKPLMNKIGAEHLLDNREKLDSPEKVSEHNLLFLHSAFPTTNIDAVFFGPDTYRYLNFIDQVLASRSKDTTSRIVDIGCGAGPGAILMALRFPKAKVLATDINQTALELTRVNAHFAGASNVKVAFSDLLNDLEGQFDVITANPPYLVDKDARVYRHGGGLLGAEFSLKMLKAAIPRLAPGGQFVLYTGAAIVDSEDVFKQEVRQYLDQDQTRELTWQYQELDPDIFGEELFNDAYADTDRIAAIGLVVTMA